MKKTMKIEGMMCTHCEARVKDALQAIKGVLAAEPSHEKGEVKITLSREVAVKKLKAVIEKQGYKVTE